MNLFDGEVCTDGNATAIAFQAGRGTFVLPVALADAPMFAQRACSKLIVGLRSENVTDLLDSNTETVVSIECSIDLLEPFRSEMVATFEINGPGQQQLCHLVAELSACAAAIKSRYCPTTCLCMPTPT